MSGTDCQRWAWLFDRASIGEILSDEERRFARQHAVVCGACSLEVSGFERLRDSIDHEEGIPALPAVPLEAILSKYAAARTVRPFAAGSGQRWALLLSAAAVVALGLGIPYAMRHRTSSLAEPMARVQVLRAGQALRDDLPDLESGATVRASESGLCLVVQPGVQACLEEGTVVRLVDKHLAHREIELVRGKIIASLQPQPAKTTFSISNRGGKATAVGTIFSVDSHADDFPAEVRVQRGVVTVEGQGASAVTVRAHQALTMGAAATREMSLDEEQLDLALLPSFREESSKGPQLDSELVPTTAPLERANALALAASSLGPSPSSAGSAEGKRLHASAPVPSGEAESSPQELLAQARNLRARGKLQEAARVYSRLLRVMQSSPSLSDERMEKEARYARIEALRALGRADEERRAIEALLKEYPFGAHSEPLRARLRALNGASANP